MTVCRHAEAYKLPNNASFAQAAALDSIPLTSQADFSNDPADHIGVAHRLAWLGTRCLTISRIVGSMLDFNR
jgi:hypothetical protein